jgi:hypothetical protein
MIPELEAIVSADEEARAGVEAARTASESRIKAAAAPIDFHGC